MLHLSGISTKETLITFASIVLMTSLLFLCTSAYAQTRPDTNYGSRTIITTIPTAAKNYPPIVPTPLSSSLTSKTHELQQEALLMPRAITKLPIRPASQASPELIVSVNVTKNPITIGEPEIFRIAIHNPNSNNNIGNAQISGIVLDPIRNSIQDKFNGISNSNGTYSYSWTIPRTIKSQTFEVKVNASTVNPILYSLKPGLATFSVKSISSDSTNPHHHHHHVVHNHSSSTNHHHEQGNTGVQHNSDLSSINIHHVQHKADLQDNSGHSSINNHNHEQHDTHHSSTNHHHEQGNTGVQHNSDLSSINIHHVQHDSETDIQHKADLQDNSGHSSINIHHEQHDTDVQDNTDH
jgi:hypothetical protein